MENKTCPSAESAPITVGSEDCVSVGLERFPSALRPFKLGGSEFGDVGCTALLIAERDDPLPNGIFTETPLMAVDTADEGHATKSLRKPQVLVEYRSEI